MNIQAGDRIDLKKGSYSAKWWVNINDIEKVHKKTNEVNKMVNERVTFCSSEPEVEPKLKEPKTK